MKLTLTLTHTSGETLVMPWRPAPRKPYTGTACGFLSSLIRADRGDWKITTEDGKVVNIDKACRLARDEMNAIQNGRRLPPMPAF